MAMYRAMVLNGRIVLNVPSDLPDRTALEIEVTDINAVSATPASFWGLRGAICYGEASGVFEGEPFAHVADKYELRLPGLAPHRFSNRAASDLESIVFAAGDEAQAQRKLDAIMVACQRYADGTAQLGVREDVRRNLCFVRVDGHMLFYVPTPEGDGLLCRILPDRLYLLRAPIE